MQSGPTTWDDSLGATPGIAAPGPWDETAGFGPHVPAPAEGRWARLARVLKTRRGRVRTGDVVLFVRHLATLLNAGLPLAKALKTVARQLENPLFAGLVVRLGEEVRAGQLLSSAMAQMPAAFDPLTVNMVRAGEIGGTLPRTLAELADDMEKKEALRRSVVGAMIYPLLVMGIASIVVGFLLIYVIPIFEGIYKKMHVELPLVTQVLLALSRGAVRYWWLLPVAVAGVLAVRQRLKGVERVRRGWERLLLRLPLLGRVRRGASAARFFSTFATLIRSGVNVVETLRLMSHLTGDLLLRDAIEEIRQHVNRGGTLARPMERHADLFSPMAVQMLSVGEETGSLPDAAARTAAFLAQDVDTRVKVMTTLIEPLLTVALGLIVGTIALAIYLPMFDLMKQVSR